MLASDGAEVILTSRSLDRAESAAKQIAKRVESGSVTAGVAGKPSQIRKVLKDAQIVIACGAAGAELVDQKAMLAIESLKVAIDLNAVPPVGIEGIGVADKAKEYGSGVGYGAIGVGGLKMKTHRAAIQSLFTSNDKVLNAAEIYEIAKSIG